MNIDISIEVVDIASDFEFTPWNTSSFVTDMMNFSSSSLLSAFAPTRSRACMASNVRHHCCDA
jgi:hypothetical protein